MEEGGWGKGDGCGREGGGKRGERLSMSERERERERLTMSERERESVFVPERKCLSLREICMLLVGKERIITLAPDLRLRQKVVR